MSAAATPPGGPGEEGASSAQVVGFLLPFIERALKDRVRYRYVRPLVLCDGESCRVQAPCCSRNVDPEGGLIDVARLTPGADGRWLLQAREHASAAWVPYAQGLTLCQALETVRVDADRVFWP